MDTLPAPQSKSSSNVTPHRREKSRDSLVYLTTCMIGHLVEVHLKDGSVYRGTFHAADVEKDFGIVLKMASLIKDSTLRGHKSRSEFFRKPPFKTFIIPADELVQVVAEDLFVSSDGTLDAIQSEKPVDLLTDSSISKFWQVDLGRELIPWKPEGNVPPSLDNVFDETLSAAEERGLQLNEKSDIDEETKYSAVRRLDEFDDSGFNEEDDKLLDTCNDQTFGGSSTSSVQNSASSSGKGFEDVRDDSRPSGDDARYLPSEQRFKDFPALDSSISESQLGERRKNNSPEVSHCSRPAGESVSGHGDIKEDAKFGGGGTSASKFNQFEAAMDTQPAPQSKSSSNVSPRRREKSRDSLVYLTTCMIGHLVEVHLENGSVYRGIFHAADVEKDFGIVLKMASLIKDCTLRRHKSRSEFFRKPPLKTFIIPAEELVQVVAEDLSVSSDGTLDAVQSEKPVELLTDSSISKSRHVDMRRELIPWEPDGKVPPGLDNVFDDTSRRGWDQFEANKSLFGVKSTFDEKQYTTILPSTLTRELEEKAHRIATEIEDEITAEERGLQLNEKSDIDEETKYSAVRRVNEFDDSGFNEEDDKLLDTCNDKTFGGSSTSSVLKTASSSGKGYEDVRGDSQPSRNNTNVDQSRLISGDDARHLPSEQGTKDFPASGSNISESQLDERRKNNSPEVSHCTRSAGESVSGHGDIKEDAKFGGGGTSASKTFNQFEAAMDTLPAPQSKSSSNVSPCRREKSRDSLVYLTTCMIGHLVEVHLENGSVYRGIFHAADVEKDFGIVLKMASLIKDSTLRGHKSRSEFFRKPPFKTFIIPADELVQVVAEDLSVSSDGTLNAVQCEKQVELLTDSSISKCHHVDLGRELTSWKPDGNVPPSLDNVFDETWSGKGYEDVQGDSQPSRSNTNVDQSCPISGDDAPHLPSEQRSKDYPAPGSSISKSQLGDRRKNNNPEVSRNSRSAEKSVSGHGDIKEGAKFGGGVTGTSASKTIAERETQGSQVSGKTKSESSFGQSDSRSSERRPAPSTPSRPGISPSSSMGSLSSSEKFTLNPDAKEFIPSQPPAAVQAQSPMENTSFYCPAAPIQQMPVQAQSPMADGSFYYPVQQMPGGYGFHPQYFEQQQMAYYQYHGQQYGQTGYPQYAQAQYPQQQQQQTMMGQPPRPPPPPY